MDDPLTDFLSKQILSLPSFTLTVGNVLMVVVVIFIAWLLNYASSKIVLLRLPTDTKSSRNSGRIKAILQLKSYIIYIFAFIILLNSLGLNLSIIIASSTALFVGIGIGLQDTFRDFMSGIIILFDGTINIGDIIEVDDKFGRVSHIGIRTSKIETPLGTAIIVPNSEFTTDKLKNWSYDEGKGATIDIGVAYDTDIERAKSILIESLTGTVETKDDHKATVFLTEFGDSAITLQLRFWVYDMFRIERIKSDVRFKINQLFKQHGINIPFPQVVVHKS